MATIVMNMGTILGTCSRTFTDTTMPANMVEAESIHDRVETGIASEIQILRTRDKASPKLAEKCASGAAIGNVTIYLVDADNGNAVLFKWVLTGTYVSRYEYETLSDSGVAYQKHFGNENFSHSKAMHTSLNSGTSASANNDYRSYTRGRTSFVPEVPDAWAKAADSGTELERVWLNYENVTWTSTDGNVSGSYDNKTGSTVASTTAA